MLMHLISCIIIKIKNPLEKRETEIYNKCINIERKIIGMAQITRDTIIGDILDIDVTTAPYFFEIGMHCLGCPSARGETLEQACAVHGVDVDALLEKLNNHLENK